MVKFTDESLWEIASSFSIDGRPVSMRAHKSGNINDTFISEWATNGTARRYVHQRVNHYVFKDVPGVMQNISKVTEHVAAKLDPNSEERTLKVIPTKGGKSYVQDAEGNYWRTYDYVEGTRSVDVCGSPAQGREASRTFGRFLSYLSDLPPECLVETIPFFQHTPRRFEAFKEALHTDSQGRKREVSREIDFALSREAFGSLLMDALGRGEIPLRATHNDLKLNNVLFGEKSGLGVCVVDLDTCMPGTALFDIGDLLRNTSVPAAEDERDLSKVEVSEELFTALIDGFLNGAPGYFNEAEIQLLPLCPRILALTLGTRFLMDYLNGDVYFKISYPNHNLDRARTQYKIVESMERAESRMHQIVQERVKRI
jgi:Ser/Thr protein kinase RdoA (MazF antagonist)